MKVGNKLFYIRKDSIIDELNILLKMREYCEALKN